jgi:hypothetical protein
VTGQGSRRAEPEVGHPWSPAQPKDRVGAWAVARDPHQRQLDRPGTVTGSPLGYEQDAVLDPPPSVPHADHGRLKPESAVGSIVVNHRPGVT